MTALFWNSQSLLLINYLEKGRTVKELQHAELIDHFEGELHKSYVWRSKKHSCAMVTWSGPPSAIAANKLVEFGCELLNSSSLQIWLCAILYYYKYIYKNTQRYIIWVTWLCMLSGFIKRYIHLGNGNYTLPIFHAGCSSVKTRSRSASIWSLTFFAIITVIAIFRKNRNKNQTDVQSGEVR